MRTRVLLIALALLLLAAGLARANGSPARPRQVLGGGGTGASAGGVTLRATLGQPVVGVVSGGGVVLGQGFWHGGTVERCIYLPLVLRGYP